MDNRIVEQFEALGLPVRSITSGIIVAKLGEKCFLYYQDDVGSLTLSDEVSFGGFSDPQALPKRVVLTLTPIGKGIFAVASTARPKSPEDIPALLPILKALQDSLAKLWT